MVGFIQHFAPLQDVAYKAVTNRGLSSNCSAILTSQSSGRTPTAWMTRLKIVPTCRNELPSNSVTTSRIALPYLSDNTNLGRNPILMLSALQCGLSWLMQRNRGNEQKGKANMEGLNKISSCDNPERLADVVFVHGLDGDAQTTRHSKNQPGLFWPK